jgi:hypothetical protein
MQCDNVIRELAVPTDDRDPASLAEHLAQCPSCARWADRAKEFGRLWEATRPAEPTGEMWDTVWTEVARAVGKSNPAEHKAITPYPFNLNGVAAKGEESGVRVSRRPGFRAGRLMAIGSLGIAQAAAIFVAVTLSWQPSARSPMPAVGDASVVPSFTSTESVATVSADGVVEIEEGQQIVIRVEGPTVRVVDRTPQGFSYNVDEWYLMLNRMEALASPPVVAVR